MDQEGQDFGFPLARRNVGRNCRKAESPRSSILEFEIGVKYSRRHLTVSECCKEEHVQNCELKRLHVKKCYTSTREPHGNQMPSEPSEFCISRRPKRDLK